jgi:O-succinylbenzoic acid--CoA ligase
MDKYRWPITYARDRFGDRTALTSDIQKLTFAECSERIGKIARGLRESGIRTGDRLALLGVNSVEYVLVLLGVIHAGAVACPLSVRLPAEAVKHQLEFLNCRKLIVFDADRATKNKSILNSADLSTLNAPGSHLGAEVPYDQLATVLFTSGSSGTPKAVAHTVANHYYSALGSNRNIPFGASDRWLLSLPLYHVGGIGIMFRAWLGGGTVVIPLANSDLFKVIQAFGITHVSVVSTQLVHLLEREASELSTLESLKCVLLGGGPVSVSLIERALRANLPLFTSYGLTEMASQVTTTRSDDSLNQLKTAGRVLDFREVKVDPAGEILVRGETLFSGYAEDNNVRLPIDSEGWFGTGDLGRLDSEGYLHILGRNDNMFISGGENIHPEEIESVLIEHPLVRDAIVVPVDSAEYGRRPVAFISWTSREHNAQKQLRDWVAAKLPRFKCPDMLLDWPENLPTDIKPERKELTKLAARLPNH